MDIVLIPGFWLNASSWDAVLPPLVAAGHSVHPLTLPGKESTDADRSGIGLRTHIGAVVDLVDRLEGKVVLVGHSGGGVIAHGVVDARPERIARVVYVDAGPLGDGGVINDEIPTEGPDAPLPPWEFFEEEDLVDLTEELRARFREQAVIEPAEVTREKVVLSNPARYTVPATVICCEFPGALLKQWIEAGSPFVAELVKMEKYEIVDLPTGHWPQFTKPRELGELLVSIVG